MYLWNKGWSLLITKHVPPFYFLVALNSFEGTVCFHKFKGTVLFAHSKYFCGNLLVERVSVRKQPLAQAASCCSCYQQFWLFFTLGRARLLCESPVSEARSADGVWLVQLLHYLPSAPACCKHHSENEGLTIGLLKALHPR